MNCSARGNTPAERRLLILRGVVWNTLFQVFLVVVNFGSMLVLVRLLSPAEFGRATAVSGLLGLINCFNCSYFISQAIQLCDGEEPDWAAHWRAGLYIQIGLGLLCNAVACGAWFLSAYRAIAPLLHVASIGVLIDCPNQLALTTLRREMDFRTLRLIQAVCVLATVASSLTLALLNSGAFALIVGSNVLHGIPFGLYLLLVRKWRPPRQWWKPPDWNSYHASLNFGMQLSSSAVLTSARGMLESLVLPVALGYEAVGLLNRAQVLFTTTVGRVSSLVTETVYPLLPRSAEDQQQYARHATLFVQTVLLISIPGAVFVAIEGPQLSRLLYGEKWIAADPLIAPGTLFAWGISSVLVFTTVLQAKNRLRLAFLSSLIVASVSLPAIAVALSGGSTRAYVWALTGGQLAASATVMAFASELLEPRWPRKALLPPFVCALAAAGALMLPLNTQNLHLGMRVSIDAVIFAIVGLFLLRCFFTESMRSVASRMPRRLPMVNLFR